LDSSIVQGPFSVAPCQTLISRFATLASLQVSVRAGHHEVARVLRELARGKSSRKAPTTRVSTLHTAEQAERMAALLIDEEEREHAAQAQSKVREGFPLARVRVSDAVSLSHE
jgi:hypothetical protein